MIFFRQFLFLLLLLVTFAKCAWGYNGELKAATDALGQAVVNTYTTGDRLVSTLYKDPQNNTVASTLYDYDPQIKYQLNGFSDLAPGSNIAQYYAFTYDTFHRLRNSFTPQGTQSITQFDALDRVKQVTHQQINSTTEVTDYTYDGLGRVSDVEHSGTKEAQQARYTESRMKKSFSLLSLLALAALALGGSSCPSRMGLSRSVTPSRTTPATPLPFDATLFAPISPRAQDRRTPVIMYHDIVASKRQKTVFFDCTADEFKDQIAFLESQGASFISAEQLHRHLVRGDALPEKPVLLTFDDNYQGFYNNAYPLLKAKKIPSVMFVHTAFVGNTKGPHPKMSWETLKKLDAEKLVTVASHTVNHPGEFEKKPLDVQQSELYDSKKMLEAQLGHPIPYIAYPEGRGDEETFALAQQIGYTLGFTVENGPAEQSPNILAVNRYIHTRLRKAWEECQRITLEAPATVFERTLTNTPVTLQVGTFDGIKLALVKGGIPLTVRATDTGRKSVGEFIRDVPGTVAGMNGTFFVNADLRSVDNALIGPCRTKIENTFFPDIDKLRMPRIWNRPLVVWGPKKIAIVPFNPYANNDESSLLSLMMDMSDVFLGGAWIVHNGVARTKKEIAPYAARDFNDPRKRAFFGVTDKGEIVLGATVEVITTEMMARGAAAAGIHEAILMDSGFSTSIVYDNKIIATGHTSKDLPSRPVPHAILLSGAIQLPTDPETLAIFQSAETSVGTISSVEAMANEPIGARPEGHPDRGKLGPRRRR